MNIIWLKGNNHWKEYFIDEKKIKSLTKFLEFYVYNTCTVYTQESRKSLSLCTWCVQYTPLLHALREIIFLVVWISTLQCQLPSFYSLNNVENIERSYKQ